VGALVVQVRGDGQPYHWLISLYGYLPSCYPISPHESRLHRTTHDASATMTGRLTLGYRDAVAAAASTLAAAGTRVHAREFHRTTVGSSSTGTAAWHWKHAGVSVTEGFDCGRVHASYLHTHWNGIPGAASPTTPAAREYRKSQNAGASPGS
jgi:hypothetical protein